MTNINVKIDQKSLQKTFKSLVKIDQVVARKGTKAGITAATKTAHAVLVANAPVGKTRVFRRSIKRVVRSYAKNYTWIGYAGQDLKNVLGSKGRSVAGRKNFGLSTGLSGKGLYVPSHLVNNPVAPHQMPGSRGPRTKPYTWIPRQVLTQKGGSRNGRLSDAISAWKINHPGHKGTHFIEKSAAAVAGPTIRTVRSAITSAVKSVRSDL